MPPEHNQQIEEGLAPLGVWSRWSPCRMWNAPPLFTNYSVCRRESGPANRSMHWAWLYGPNVPDWRRGPNLMLTRSEGVVEAGDESSVLSLCDRSRDVARGTPPCGTDSGPIGYPDYLPKGELELRDPRRILPHACPKQRRHTLTSRAFRAAPFARGRATLLSLRPGRAASSALRPPSGGLQPFRNRQRPPGTLHARPHAPW